MIYQTPVVQDKDKKKRGLSPGIFKIYINKIMREWKNSLENGIRLRDYKIIQSLIYADDQVLIVESND
jgi:hypothetical protein